MRYNRADLDDTMRVARLVTKRDGGRRFVYATACGYIISQTAPPCTQNYYRISPDKVELCQLESRGGNDALQG